MPSPIPAAILCAIVYVQILPVSTTKHLVFSRKGSIVAESICKEQDELCRNSCSAYFFWGDKRFKEMCNSGDKNMSDFVEVRKVYENNYARESNHFVERVRTAQEWISGLAYEKREMKECSLLRKKCPWFEATTANFHSFHIGWPKNIMASRIF